VARGQRQTQATLKLAVPHCARCAQLTKSIFLVGCLPAAAGGLLVGAVAFAAAFWLAAQAGLDEVDTDEFWPSLTVGAAAGLFAGLLAGILAELAARLLLLPLFGRVLWSAQLLAAQMLGNLDYVAGLTGKLSADGRELELKFANEGVAREFAALNGTDRQGTAAKLG
jgi:hypothetical protein